MLVKRNDDMYGDFPTLEEIKRDLNELLTEVKDIHTVEKVKEFSNKFQWITIEINGDLRKNATPNDLEIEWIRYEAYGCLSYIYVRTDGDVYFDVWSNACNFDFIDSARVSDINENFVNGKKMNAEFFLEKGMWK